MGLLLLSSPEAADTSVVGAGSVTVTATAALTTSITATGAGTVTVTGAGVLTTAITSTGVAAVTFTGLGALTTAIPLVGAGTVTITGAGALDAVAAELVGAASIAFTGASTLSTSIALTAASTITVTGTGALAGTVAALEGAASVEITGAGTLSTSIALVGAASFAITATSTLSTSIVLAGAGSVVFAGTATFEVDSGGLSLAAIVDVPVRRWIVDGDAMATRIVPGDTIYKDPEANRLYQFSWANELEAEGLTVLSSTWTVIEPGGDTALIVSNQSTLAGNLINQVLLSGGNLGRRYRVENKITTSGSPTQTDEKSFYLKIRET